MGAPIGLRGAADPIRQDVERKATHNNADSQISREVTRFQTGRPVREFGFTGRTGRFRLPKSQAKLGPGTVKCSV